MDDVGSITVAGDTARAFRYPGTNDFVAIWRRAGRALEARGVAPDVDAFRTIVGSMRSVTVDDWLAAMPASVVKPASRSEVVDEMLSGLPCPVASTSRRCSAAPHFGILSAWRPCSGAVACAWISRWLEARRRNDESGARGRRGDGELAHVADPERDERARRLPGGAVGRCPGDGDGRAAHRRRPTPMPVKAS